MSVFRKFFTLTIIGAIIIGVGIIIGWYLLFAPPSKIIVNESRFKPSGAAVIRMEAGTSLTEFAGELQDRQIIKSSSVFLSLVQKMKIEKNIKQGIYIFSEPQNLIQIMRRLSKSDYGYTPVKITIPEGYTTKAISEYVPGKLVDIDAPSFLLASEGMEGYLFPDTYFLYPYATSSAVIDLMQANFKKRIKLFEADIANSGRSLAEIITLASILEKEVQTEVDKQTVSDLFWRRIAIGMPLQADSTLTYYKGKTSAQLTLKDLAENTPYNSYVYKGLPPGPISNPGIVSIKAALYPLANEYVFFLSDKDGVTHFSKTFAEHVLLKKKYLR